MASTAISTREVNLCKSKSPEPKRFRRAVSEPKQVIKQNSVERIFLTTSCSLEKPSTNNDEKNITDDSSKHTEINEEKEDEGGIDALLTNIKEQKNVNKEEQKIQSPEIIQLDDDDSTPSSPAPNNQALPKLSTSENGKDSEFIGRRRVPFRRPSSLKRRKRTLQNTSVTVTPTILSPVVGNRPIMLPTIGDRNIHLKPLTPIWNMIKNFPKEISNDYTPFHEAMCQWKWESIDEVNIPVIIRDSHKFVAYSVAHIKLFSKFPTNVDLLPSHLTLDSLPMTEAEAWMMNFINTIICNYELGMQIFQNGDNLVELNAVELYYLYAKKHYLEDLLKIYDGAVPQEAFTECKNIIGAIFNLKKKILIDLKKLNEQIKLRQNNHLNPYHSSPITQSQLYLST